MTEDFTPKTLRMATARHFSMTPKANCAGHHGTPLVLCQQHGGYEDITGLKTLKRPSLPKSEGGLLQRYHEVKRSYKINYFFLTML